MGDKLRRTSIDIVGDVPWGTHFCQFYETKEDLTGILVPYFKMGLENNEFCMWITSEPLSVEDAKKALKKEVKDLDDCVAKGRIEILDYSQWYTKSGYFDASQVLQGWVEKERQALRSGFDGLRLSGNTFWLEKRDWRNFTEYEASVNSIIGQYRMLAICTYCLGKCSASEIIDVVSNHQFALIKREGKWRIIESAEHKKTAEALRRSEERYALAQRVANIGSWDWDIGTGELVWSEQIEPMFGFGRGEFSATYEAFLACVHPEDRQHVIDSVNACAAKGKDYAIEHRIICPDETVRWVSETGNVIRDKNGKAIRMLGVVQDITERKGTESRQQLAGRILECLNRKKMEMDIIRDVLALARESTGFEAVGIRLREGDDFPYFVTKGFPEDFLEAENYLCARDQNGELIYDSQGHALLECMCGSVISGRTDPALPFFTESGSFWTNSTTKLLECTPPEDLQVRTRNRCNEAGYESVALIPLRSDRQVIGLLQLNDTRPGRLSLEMIRFFEEIGASIGIALARIRAEQDIKNLAKFPSENPSPILRIGRDGTLLYANAASASLLTQWNCREGQAVPTKWHQMVSEVFAADVAKTVEIEHESRVFSFLLTPVAEVGYVNLYGRDITERKQAEDDLRKYRQHLEELVQARTEELTEANKQLLREIEERRRLEREILAISERERRRIGHELHDSLGQQLTGIAIMTKVLEQKLDGRSLADSADAREIGQLVNRALEETRGLAKGLHPVDLGADGLMSALQELAAHTGQLFGIRCTFSCDRPVRIGDASVAIHLYRIAQEAVTNAIKHGKAENIVISLASDSNMPILTVRSDGLDFPEAPPKDKGMGLQIMGYRAEMIDAWLDVRRDAPGGTVVTCAFSEKKWDESGEQNDGSGKTSPQK